VEKIEGTLLEKERNKKDDYVRGQKVREKKSCPEFSGNALGRSGNSIRCSAPPGKNSLKNKTLKREVGWEILHQPTPYRSYRGKLSEGGGEGSSRGGLLKTLKREPDDGKTTGVLLR